jgi:hypothetical protein
VPAPLNESCRVTSGLICSGAVSCQSKQIKNIHGLPANNNTLFNVPSVALWVDKLCRMDLDVPQPSLSCSQNPTLLLPRSFVTVFRHFYSLIMPIHYRVCSGHYGVVLMAPSRFGFRPLERELYFAPQSSPAVRDKIDPTPTCFICSPTCILLTRCTRHIISPEHPH